ncbi:Kunitz/Bovine pancreatic trypsin inhibitor domain protein [Ancylostoma caninum]|uniref:Kunitz/Bovine pancreatic trypsin inhibitor domain protein n=1 Tax=Ancylostoma caninum TaxID=29170 RepID=A0A368H8R6_ANCCA|nr:Kunitz/Bovine pancreatic trypsin inhibitor domain protein [Ancylostoma caninum]
MRPLLLALFLVIFASLCISAKDSHSYEDYIHPRFSYSIVKRKCVRFYYGGCNAGPNNFKTKKQCMRACERFRYKS